MGMGRWVWTEVLPGEAQTLEGAGAFGMFARSGTEWCHILFVKVLNC